MVTVILCDGRTPPEKKLKAAVKNAEFFIAADGGANTARKLNLMPDCIIGDMDSFTPAPEDPARIITDPDQETNDLEKALSYVKESGASRVTVFGALGRRPDHTLKNLSVLKRFHSGFTELKYIDNYGELFLLPCRYQSRLPVGTTLSLMPLGGPVHGIRTTGLKYPLNGETLENGLRDGSSNETVKEEIVITFEKGDLLLFIASSPEEWP